MQADEGKNVVEMVLESGQKFRRGNVHYVEMDFRVFILGRRESDHRLGNVEAHQPLDVFGEEREQDFGGDVAGAAADVRRRFARFFPNGQVEVQVQDFGGCVSRQAVGGGKELGLVHGKKLTVCFGQYLLSAQLKD